MHRRQNQAFTLVELLVVAIIALLLSILLPALGRAKEIAEKVACGANQRQIGQGMFLYASDYNARLPAARNEGGRPWPNPYWYVWGGGTWAYHIGKYVGLDVQVRVDESTPYRLEQQYGTVLHCPTWANSEVFTRIEAVGGNPIDRWILGGYGMNRCLPETITSQQYNWFITDRQWRTYPNLNSGDMKSTSARLLLSDGSGNNASLNTNWEYNNRNEFSQPSGHFSVDYLRHQESPNLLMVDGHVTQLPAGRTEELYRQGTDIDGETGAQLFYDPSEY